MALSERARRIFEIAITLTEPEQAALAGSILDGIGVDDITLEFFWAELTTENQGDFACWIEETSG